MSETSLLDVMFRSLRASARLIGAGAEANRVLELDGVTAAIVPSTPDRSVQRVELVPRRLERVHGVLVAVTRPNRPRPHASLVVGGPCAPVPRPRRNGGGLTGLLHRALTDARARGCETSTTQATSMGRPVYTGLGYRDLGPVLMYERRRS